jgi:hypothetical protein
MILCSARVVFGLFRQRRSAGRPNARGGLAKVTNEQNEQNKEKERGKKQNSLNFEVDETAQMKMTNFQHGALFFSEEANPIKR